MGVLRFESERDLVGWAVKEIVTSLEKAIESRGQAIFIASGGRSPVPIMAALSEADLDWSKVTVTLSDERWVDQASPKSNERLVRDLLLKNKAREAKFLSLKTEHDTPDQGALALEPVFSVLPQPFDIALLGMGHDGHTASLFPNGEGAANARHTANYLASVTPDPLPPEAPYPRITLSLSALAGIERILLLASDNRKLALLDQYGEKDSKAMVPVHELVRRAGTKMTALWAPSG